MRSKWTLAGSSACILASSPSSVTTQPTPCTVPSPNVLSVLSLFSLSLSLRFSLSRWNYHPLLTLRSLSLCHLGAHLRPTLMREGAAGFAGLAPNSKQTQARCYPLATFRIICRFVAFFSLSIRSVKINSFKCWNITKIYQHEKYFFSILIWFQ